MKRTPRSARRRAIRQLAAKCRASASRGRRARRCDSGSFDRSVSSGTDACIRNAISYCAIRVVISGLSTVLELDLVQLAPDRSMKLCALRAIEPFRVRDIQHRIADRSQLDALILARQEAGAPQPLGERLAGAGHHHDERRQILVLAAQAVVTQAPMLGRPASWNPVCAKVTAGSWLICSVCIDLMKHSSSAIFAVCGISSLTHAPDWPCCANCEDRRRDREASPAPRSSPSAAGRCGSNPAGRCRAHFSSSGL